MSDTGVLRTRAAEGLDRRAFSMADVEKMIEAGVLDPDERFELIDGEIVPMNSQAMPHMLMRSRITNWLVKLAPAGVEVVTEATLLLGDNTFFETDVLAFTLDTTHRYVAPGLVHLAVEVADTSRARDLFAKAPRYGAADVPELWVVELNERTTYVFQRGAWADPKRISFDDWMAPSFLPGHQVRLADFEV